MSDPFRTAAFDQTTLSPDKRVNYSMGLVLGVDEFEQEQFYLLERDRLHNRALHGYGTVYGLDVQFNDGEIQVLPGLAVDSHGQHICVPDKRCADLAKWISSHEQDILNQVGSNPTSVNLFVTLCYRECKSDSVPVPGEPCRTQADTMVASRITDDFELRLGLTPPAQPQEELVDRFGDLLSRIEIRENASNFLDASAMEALVLGLLQPPTAGSIPEAASIPGSLPGTDELYLRPEEACDLLEAAFRTWITRVRGALMGAECGPGDDDACLLLARVEIDLVTGSQGLELDPGEAAVRIDQRERPILLHTRLLQEWLLCTRLSRTLDVSRQFVILFMLTRDTVRAWLHYPEVLTLVAGSVQIMADDIQLGLASLSQSIPGVNVFDIQLDRPLNRNTRLEALFDLNSITNRDGVTLRNLLDGDEYSLLDRDGDFLRAYHMIEAVALDDLVDVNASQPQDGQVLTWTIDSTGEGSWTAADVVALEIGDAGGDLSGTYPDPVVVQLQGHPISNAVPAPNQVLTWLNDAWTPQLPNAAGGDRLEEGLVHIFGLNWQHDKPSDLRVSLATLDQAITAMGFVVVFGRKEPVDDGLVQISTVNENTFQVFIELPDPETGFLRCLRIPAEPIPVMVKPDTPDSLFRDLQVMELSAEGQDLLQRGLAHAFFLQLDPEKLARFIFGARLSVILKGDFILDGDDNSRAIDAEFVRAGLPTGDNPNNLLIGLQGGLFESWTELRLAINLATALELAALTGNQDVANQIVNLRDAGGPFKSLKDFRTRLGQALISRDMISRLASVIMITKPG